MENQKTPLELEQEARAKQQAKAVKAKKVKPPKVKKPAPKAKPETIAYRQGMTKAENMGIGDKWVAGVITSLAIKSNAEQRATLAKFFGTPGIDIIK